jgi:hypothetical protein
MNETKTFTIRTELLNKVTAVIDRLNRRASKLGVEPIAFSRTPSALREIKNQITGKGVWHEVTEITLSLNVPKLADWSFVCTIQHAEGGNLLLTVPGTAKLDLSAYRTCAPTCCHCNLERNRADTYVVLHDVTGAFKQVGKNCLASFTGFGKSPEQAAAMAEWLSAVVFFIDDPAGDNEEREGGYGGGSAQGVSLNTFLAYVVAVSKVHGFRTRKQAEAQMTSSTKDDAIYNMEPPKNVSVSKLIRPDDSDREFALSARTWAKYLETKSDFDHNLKVIASADGVLYRNLGIAAYIVEAYRKHLGMTAERAARPASLHFGVEKERLRGLRLTYRGNYSFDSQYGTTFIHRFVTENGSDAIWKTGSMAPCTEGETIAVDATVKKHGDYKGRLQTELSRVKVVA